MDVLAVPNWSIGRDKRLNHQLRETLEEHEVAVHFCKDDLDHHRTVTAFSGEWKKVRAAVEALAAIVFDRVDLNRHVGVHPRIGALDVCPFVSLDDQEGELIRETESFARDLSEKYGLPIYLYELSEKGRHEADLPSLRKGGFGSLLERELDPDFGPTRCHPNLGVAVVGVRRFLIAMNVNLNSRHVSVAKSLARQIRNLRQEGDPRFLGVRALGLPLASRDMIQVSMNLTLPDLTPIDPIVEWVRLEASNLGVGFSGTELIGVIRDVDLPTATHLRIQPEQVIHSRSEAHHDA